MCQLCEMGIPANLPRCSYQEYGVPDTIGDAELARMYESQGNRLMAEVHRLSRTRARAIIMWIARTKPEMLEKAVLCTRPADGIMSSESVGQ